MNTISEIIGLNWIVIGPTLALVATALILLFCTITVETSDTTKKVVTISGIFATLFSIFLKFGLFFTDGTSSYFSEKILLDEFSLFGNVLLGLVLLFNFYPIWNSSYELKEKTTEAVILTLMSTAGFMLMVDSENFMMLFIGLEIGSISLYALAGINKGSLLSNEASLKYFLLGSLASCVLVYGISLMYVSLSITGVYETTIAISFIGAENIPLTTLIGFLLLIIGLLFKVAAAPFQSWAPDVYQGSPTGYVGFMASSAKVASFIVLARLCVVSLGFTMDKFELFFTAVIILSIFVGSLFATVQTDMKRLIAYSGVVQSGFILSGITSGVNGTSASLFYLAAYVIQLTGIFLIFSAITGELSSDFSMDNLSGLFVENKFITICFSIFMLGLAGLPLTSGFISKFILITNLWSYEKYILVFALMLSTVAGFYFYLKPIWVAAIDKPDAVVSKITLKLNDKISIGMLAGITILLGLFPNILINISRWVIQNYL
ncbi:NADH-quinone oxidoreductase subunit N [bacterium]|nr:NADH-quinone oxidoreductase subunit N [Candidatus Actinomarina sp.]MDA9681482.1 NADH-quinone oxidoreductase subunit N [bacterium]